MCIRDRIRDREVRLIGADGAQMGVVSIQVAMRAAEDAGLDLGFVSASRTNIRPRSMSFAAGSPCIRTPFWFTLFFPSAL